MEAELCEEKPTTVHSDSKVIDCKPARLIISKKEYLNSCDPYSTSLCSNQTGWDSGKGFSRDFSYGMLSERVLNAISTFPDAFNEVLSKCASVQRLKEMEKTLQPGSPMHNH